MESIHQIKVESRKFWPELRSNLHNLNVNIAEAFHIAESQTDGVTSWGEVVFVRG